MLSELAPVLQLTLLNGIIHQQTIHMASFIMSALARPPPQNHP
jgi:hypothetical protein